MILIIIAASAVRYLYSLYHPTITVASDTFGYWEFESLDERTPVYPFFLKLLMKLQRFSDVAILSDRFYTGANLIVLTQHIIGILSLIILYLILRLLKIKKFYAVFFTLFISINPMVFSWERVLVTETLTIFFLLASVFVFLKFLKSLKSIYLFFLLLLFIFGFLLKPIYALFPFFLLPIIPFYKKTKKSFALSIFILLVYLLIPLIYLWQNKINYNYTGINRSGDINFLGKILKYDLPVEEARDISYFYENVKNYRSINGDPMPYRFLEYYDPRIYDTDKKKLLNLLPEFNSRVIKANLPLFVSKSFAQLPPALLEVSEFIEPNPMTDFFQKLQYFFFLVFILFPMILLRFFRKNDFRNASVLLLGMISFYQIFFSVFLSYGEFGRLIAPVQPIIYLFIFLSLPVLFPVFKIIFDRPSDPLRK